MAKTTKTPQEIRAMSEEEYLEYLALIEQEETKTETETESGSLTGDMPANSLHIF